MAAPQIDDFQMLGLVGEGACGAIFMAQSTDGLDDKKWWAVRVFNSLAVNVPLIEGMMGRLNNSRYPDGLIPITWKKSQQGHLCMIMPLLAEVKQNHDQPATASPHTLEKRMKDHSDNDATWSMIHDVAEAIASMHQHRVPHGNLKPGNIFFDPKGHIQLSDLAMGHMPGVSIPPFTDALLYAPPEQLSNPKGYLSGKGYGWDTYAFGMIAFQMLTGKIPDCESTRQKVIPALHHRKLSSLQNDVVRLTKTRSQKKLSSWLEEAVAPRKQQLRKIIARCLALDPEERYTDLSEVLHAWHDIEIEKEIREAQSELHQQTKSNKLAMGLTGSLAAVGLIGCGILATVLSNDRARNKAEDAQQAKAVSQMKLEFAKQIETEQQSTKEAQSSETQAKNAQQTAEVREKKSREQLISLGVANDHLLAWMMRDHSQDLPELKKSATARDTLLRELNEFLKLTEGNEQFQPVRARIMMQLAELEIHQKNPAKADPLIDSAVAAWSDAGIKEPGHVYRVARARLACLIQALDQQKSAFAAKLLPKARKAAQANSSNDAIENQRLKAVMHVIDGRMIQSNDPARALEYFQSAIQEMKGIQRTLTENIIVRSDLARYTLEAANLSETLNRVDDANRLREDAATALEKLLKMNPDVQLPKIQLAKIHIISATADVREGNDTEGAQKLAKAEKLLDELPPNDISPDGVAMQIATAKGLRAVLLRDAGKNSDAQRTLNEAIQITNKIVAERNKQESGSNEPLYRLAVLHWQLAGLVGDSGDTSAELRQGKKAADLMEDLLRKDAGKHDNAMRRGLGYLYGDLGHTAAQQGNKNAAATYFKNAATIWQSLITKYGKTEEYTDGLKWSQTRQREMNGGADQ